MHRITNGIITTVKNSDWLTINEATRKSHKNLNDELSTGDIYRQALLGNIRLSIYFQSTAIFKKVIIKNNKIMVRVLNGDLVERLCLLSRSSFLSKSNLITSTEGRFLSMPGSIIDTNLIGIEYVIVQRFLAEYLKMPAPITDTCFFHSGITVCFQNQNFILYEETPWEKRFKVQISNLHLSNSEDIQNNISSCNFESKPCIHQFPIYSLPNDACLVIRKSEFEKLLNIKSDKEYKTTSSTRISTPLSRLFWLACKNNETISPLINQPYKLLSIFEEWATAEGITDHLSGDTLKTALERGGIG